MRMTKTQKAILKLNQIAEKLKTDSYYNGDEFLQEVAEDIKSSADLLEKAYKDLKFVSSCIVCEHFKDTGCEKYKIECTPRTNDLAYKWRGDTE